MLGGPKVPKLKLPVFKGGKKSPLSLAYMIKPKPICLLLLRHLVVKAFVLALASAGSTIAARMAMIAMTTNSSIRVNPLLHEYARR